MRRKLEQLEAKAIRRQRAHQRVNTSSGPDVMDPDAFLFTTASSQVSSNILSSPTIVVLPQQPHAPATSTNPPTGVAIHPESSPLIPVADASGHTEPEDDVVAQVTAERDEAVGQVDQLTQDTNHLQSELQAANATITDLNQRVTELTAAAETTRSAHDVVVAELATITQRLSERNRECARMAGEVSGQLCLLLSVCVLTRSRQIATVEDQLAQRDVTSLLMEMRTDDLKHEARVRNRDLKTEITRLRSNISEKDTEIREQAEEIVKLRKDVHGWHRFADTFAALDDQLPLVPQLEAFMSAVEWCPRMWLAIEPVSGCRPFRLTLGANAYRTPIRTS